MTSEEKRRRALEARQRSLGLTAYKKSQEDLNPDLLSPGPPASVKKITGGKD